MASIYKHREKWRCQVVIDGKRKSKSGFDTKREASAWGAEQEKNNKENVLDIPDHTLEDALIRYRDTVSINKRSAKIEARRIDRWLGLGKSDPNPLIYMLLKDIQPRDIAEWRDKRLAEVSPGSVVREWTIVSGCLYSMYKRMGLDA